MFKKLVMALATLLIFGLAVEAFCRFARPDERLWDPYEFANSLFRMLRYDAVLGWSGRPGAKVMNLNEYLNTRGQRGPEFPDAKPDGVTRIVALGDSCTFNVQFYDLNREIPKIVLENPYPALLGKALTRYETAEKKYEVINGGVIGYSTLQGLRFMRERTLRWEPDVFLIRFGWNDHWLREPSYSLRPEPRNPLIRWFYAQLTRSYFYRFVTRLSATLTDRLPNAAPAANRPRNMPPPGPEDVRVPPEEFEFNLRLMVRMARRHGAVPILINAPAGAATASFVNSEFLEPFLQSLGYRTLEDVFRMHDRYNRIVAKVAREEDSPFIDLDAAFAKRGREALFGPTEVLHPNQAGHALTVELVLRELRRLGIVPEMRRSEGTLPRPTARIRGSSASPNDPRAPVPSRPSLGALRVSHTWQGGRP